MSKLQSHNPAPAEFKCGGEIVWRPSDEMMKSSRLNRFMDRHQIPTFADLHRRSIDDIEWFWKAVLEDLDIQFYESYKRIVDLSHGIAWPQWCVGGRMNIVHNCVDKWIGTATENRLAILWEGEEGSTRSLTYGELSREVNRLANALREIGLGKGDVVGIFMPMVPEIAIAVFAVAKIGAIVLPLFSGYGAGAVASRLIDAEAKALITADGFYRRGEIVPLKSVADEALSQVSGVKNVLVFPRTGGKVGWQSGRDLWWHEAVDGKDGDMPTEKTSAEDPLMIIYTSGTTGKPKGVSHAHCGFPVKAAQDMVHGLDVRNTDRFYWVTDMGWMMGPWEVFGGGFLS